MYNVTKRKPDKRLNWIFKNINGASNILAPSIIQKSNFIKVGSTGTGEIKEVIPIIASKLNIFDPIKFPKTTSAFFLTTAINVVASSGNDVPIATNVSPITASLIPYGWKILLESSSPSEIPEFIRNLDIVVLN